MNRRGVNRPLVALLAGGAAYLLTREPFVGPLVAAGVWFFWQAGRPAPDAPPGPEPARTGRPRGGGGVEVVCKQVTAERQEWVSARTGRLYDVLAANGPIDPKPGDRAYAVPTPSGYRIDKETES